MHPATTIKLLLFSDLHRDTRAANDILQRSGSVDVVIGAGDFATARRGLERTLKILRQIKTPTVLVPGNSESLDELTAACAGWSAAHVLHGNGVELAGIPFFGLGGAVPVTPFGAWSYDLTEDEARELLSACPARAVMVTHSPPKGVVDRSSSGASFGSLAVLEAIERTEPRLVVCGHIHESAGQTAVIGQSPVVNAGPRAIAWELKR
jgi:Icc-related predicted phosphoesterase